MTTFSEFAFPSSFIAPLLLPRVKASRVPSFLHWRINRRAFKMCIGRKIGTTRSKINQNCPEFKEQPRKKLVGASPHTYEDGKFGGSFVFKKSWNAVGRQFSVELETL